MITVSHLLILSGLLLSIGLIGVITRRNIIMVLLSLELMLSASNLAFVAFSYYWNDLSGQIMVFFVMVVAAAEVAVGLAIAVLLVRQIGSPDTDKMKQLKW